MPCSRKPWHACAAFMHSTNLPGNRNGNWFYAWLEQPEDLPSRSARCAISGVYNGKWVEIKSVSTSKNGAIECNTEGWKEKVMKHMQFISSATSISSAQEQLAKQHICTAFTCGILSFIIPCTLKGNFPSQLHIVKLIRTGPIRCVSPTSCKNFPCSIHCRSCSRCPL